MGGAKRRFSRRDVSGGLASVAGLAACTEETSHGLRLRFATDVGPGHLLTETLTRFTSRLNERFPGAFRIERFHSGQIYRDRDLARAILRDDIDLAAPTIFTLSRIVPDCGITSLPMFYGRGPAETHRAIGSNIGDRLVSRLAALLGAQVLRPFVDLGHVNLFLTERGAARRQRGEPIKTRIPSGAVNVWRVRTGGDYPIMIPWSDVPLALAQGNVDAIESTMETVRTGSLWEVGIRHGEEQQPAFLQYVPMFGARFWSSIAPVQRDYLMELWAEIGGQSQALSAARQADARLACIEHGVRFSSPNPAEVTRRLARLEADLPNLIQHLRVDPQLVASARRQVEGGRE